MRTPRFLNAVLRKDFTAFSEKVCRMLVGSQIFLPNWHIEAMAHALEQNRLGIDQYLMILLPPRYLKSLIASVAYPAWLLGHDPSTEIMCVSYGEDLAKHHSRNCRAILTSPWYQALFPNVVLTKATEEVIETTQNGARYATSIGGTVTGLGAHYLIIDDPMKPEDANSELKREAVIEYFQGTLFGRLTNKGTARIILVMQRLHERDLAGFLLAEPGWKALCLPAIATSDEVIDLSGGRQHHRKIGEALHPAWEPIEVLMRIRARIGASAYESQQQQSPIPATGNMLKAEWLRFYQRRPDRTGGRLMQSWDTAIKGASNNDYSVCTTWLELHDRHYLIDIFRRQMDSPEVEKAIVRLYQEFKPDGVLVEDQGSGQHFVLNLTSLPIIGWRSKDNKETRLNNCLPMFETGKVFLPEDAPGLAEYQKELLGFPSARHDDQVDSTTQYLLHARERARDSQFSYDFGDDHAATPEEIAEDLLWRRLRGY